MERIAERMILLILLGVATGAMAQSSCITACTSPRARCDFYFEGYEDSIPTFGLASNSRQEQVLSPRIRSFKLNATANVEVDAVNNGTMYCRGRAVSARGQFYVTEQAARLHSRVFQTIPGVKWFENRCVVLRLTHLQVPNKAWTSVDNLNPKDGNRQFPESRRCIVFKTAA